MADETNVNSGKEIDLLQIFSALWLRRRFIILWALAGMMLGLIAGLSTWPEYRSVVKMVPEGNGGASGGLSGFAAMAGLNMRSGNTDGINTEIYPDIVRSTPFLFEVAAIPVTAGNLSREMSFYEYLDTEIKTPWWRSVIGFPFRLLSLVRSGREITPTGEMNAYRLTPAQEGVFGKIKESVQVNYDVKTSVLTLAVVTQDPEVSALVADSVVAKLQHYITAYRTNKAKQDYEFTQNLYNEAKQRYYEAQQTYANYTDANQSVVRMSVTVEGDRLRNEMMLAYNIYTSLSQELESAKIKVQEQTPVLTVIEPARVQYIKVNMGTISYMVLFTLLGGFIAAAVLGGRYLFRSEPADRGFSAEGNV